MPCPERPPWTALQAVAVLVPLNFVLIAAMHERGFTVSSTAPVVLFLFVQSVIVAVLSRAAEGVSAVPAHAHHIALAPSLPGYALLAFALVGIFLLVRCLLTRKPVDSALLWSLSAYFLSLHFNGSVRTSTVYSAVAACILGVSIIENSYLLAYHDELTTLPSRRAFNDALLRLQDSYSIAMVDIDHFKRFNDTYGHDTGDEVLRLVAASLARVTGGGQPSAVVGRNSQFFFPEKQLPKSSIIWSSCAPRSKRRNSACAAATGGRFHADRTAAIGGLAYVRARGTQFDSWPRTSLRRRFP